MIEVKAKIIDTEYGYDLHTEAKGECSRKDMVHLLSELLKDVVCRMSDTTSDQAKMVALIVLDTSEKIAKENKEPDKTERVKFLDENDSSDEEFNTLKYFYGRDGKSKEYEKMARKTVMDRILETEKTAKAEKERS